MKEKPGRMGAGSSNTNRVRKYPLVLWGLRSFGQGAAFAHPTMTEHDSHGTPANPTTDSRAHRGRDARKGAQKDGTDSNDNKPPKHGKNTHTTPGAYLEAAPPETAIEEIATAYQNGEDPREKWGDA